MAFTVKKGDLIYAADATLGFVVDVYRPLDSSDPDAGWAVVDVPGMRYSVYFTAADIVARDETVPSVLLKLTYAEASDEAHQRIPDAVSEGQAQADEVSPLDVGRPEGPIAELSPDAFRDWPASSPPDAP